MKKTTIVVERLEAVGRYGLKGTVVMRSREFDSAGIYKNGQRVFYTRDPEVLSALAELVSQMNEEVE